MMETINSFLAANASVFDLFYKIIMLVIVGFGLYEILVQKKSMQYATTKDCINIHRDILRKQQMLKATNCQKHEEHKIYVRDHLGLVSDELFYMRNGYLPKRIALNWLRHMIDFVPVRFGNVIVNERDIQESKVLVDFFALGNLNAKGINPYYKYYMDLLDKDGSFNRIYKTFVVKKSYGAKLSDEDKKEIVQQVWKNIKKVKY